MRPFLRKIWSRLLGWFIAAVCGAIISNVVTNYLNRSKEETSLAQYYVAMMPTQCKPKTSKELDDKVKRFKEALKNAKSDGRGIPVWRDDCSIGTDYSITFKEQIGVKDMINPNGKK